MHQQAPYWAVGLSVLTFADLVYLTLKGTPPNFYTDPLLWRVFGVGTAHHSLIIFMVTAVYLVLWRVYKLDRLFAMLALWFAIVWYETVWWFTDAPYLVLTHTPFNPLWFFGWIELAAAITFFVWYVIGGYLPWRFMVFVTVLYAVWALLLGFPVTINFVITPLYGVPWVNAWEIFTHAATLTAFVLLEGKRLRGESNRFDRLVNKA